jgi:hypothetical protein
MAEGPKVPSAALLEAAHDRAMRCFGIGLTLLVVGVVVVAVSLSRPAGGYYLLPIGLFAYGLWLVLKGAIGGAQLRKEMRDLGYRSTPSRADGMDGY